MHRAGLALLVAGLCVVPSSAAAPPPIEQWIAVVAPDLRAAVEPLVQHRRGQGLRVVVLSVADVLTARDLAAGDASKLRTRLRTLCRAHPGKSSILLVGAIAAGFLPRGEHLVVPSLSGTIGRMKGQPSDVGFGCLDDSRLPTVAVGRFPARSPAEARAMVDRTLTLERAVAPGVWKRRLTVLAGIPAYNPIVDRLVENLAFARFDRLHPAWSGRAIYTSPQSRFALPDRLLRSQALAYLGEGQAFTLYLGHSDPVGFYAGPTAAFLDRNDWARVKMPHGGGVFVTFGCQGCQLTGRDGEGYGVHAMRNPHGPAAVIGSHGICYAAMVQLAADGLVRRALHNRLPDQLGTCWLAMLRGLAEGPIDFLSYRMLDAVDGDPRTPQSVQRQEHLEMFVLLGDPALRLPAVAEDVRIHCGSLMPGMALEVRGVLPHRLRGAGITATLERTPGSSPVDLDPVPGKADAPRDRAMLTNHRRANRFVLATATTTADGNSFALRLDVPAKLPWPRLILRVRAVRANEESVTALHLPIPTP